MNTKNNERLLSPEKSNELLSLLHARFEKNMNRHKGLSWPDVLERLRADSGKLWSLKEMERTGGEPDVVGFDKETGEFVFYDCVIPASPPFDHCLILPIKKAPVFTGAF